MALVHAVTTVATSDAAFITLFAIFVAATMGLVFLTLRWVIRRDKAGRAAWLERRQSEAPPPEQP